MVMEVVHEDPGDGNTQCTNHPYKNSTAGGICAFCLQEKLGKLVSSSYPAAVFPSSSSSPSPSFRSSAAAAAVSSGGTNDCTRKSRLPFVKKPKSPVPATLVFKRSKSTANYNQDYSPNRRGFWSFFKKSDKVSNFTSSAVLNNENRTKEEGIEDVGPIDRKVSRSRSVGCGSRSFSGDFFERISTGFGDCTLRRVESHREGGRHCIKERVKCGGIFFPGFMITSSSSSDQENGKFMSSSLGHVRSKSWGWAFASPMRAFGKNSAVKKNATPKLAAAVPSLLAVSG